MPVAFRLSFAFSGLACVIVCRLVSVIVCRLISVIVCRLVSVIVCRLISVIVYRLVNCYCLPLGQRLCLPLASPIFKYSRSLRERGHGYRRSSFCLLPPFKFLPATAVQVSVCCRITKNQ
ncbi:MAG: hypothetical protein RBQ94_03125 [Methanimicrococcus sp.]|nr:hypothetical protein [Methanimicrococcus sp.]